MFTRKMTVIWFLLLLTILCFLPAPQLAQANPRTQVAQRWFVPNLISMPGGDPRDYQHFDTLFVNPADYSKVLREVDVVGFFGWTIANNPSNWLSRWAPLAQTYGVKTAMEAGALEQDQCDPANSGTVIGGIESGWISQVVAAGGSVNYVQMDDPLLRLRTGCGFTLEQSEMVILQYMQTIHVVYPDTLIGMTVSYPNYAAFGVPAYGDVPAPDYPTQFVALLAYLRANVENIAFLHSDSPWEFMNCTAPSASNDCASFNWWQRLKQLELLAEANGVEFGAIYNPAFTTTDHQYFARTNSYLTTYAARGTSPADYVWESWHPFPSALTPVTQPYTALYDADYDFKTLRGTCGGVPGLICP